MGSDERDREKRSWRDIDRKRDGSDTSSGPGRGRDEERKGSGYSRYKSQLNRLFDTGKAGSHVDSVMSGATQRSAESGSEPSQSPPGRAGLVRACRLAEGHSEFVAAVNCLVDEWALPDDLELLLRVVDHPRDEVVLQALQRIEGIIQRAPLKNKAAFVQRLLSLEQTAENSDLRVLVDRLLEQLG